MVLCARRLRGQRNLGKQSRALQENEAIILQQNDSICKSDDRDPLASYTTRLSYERVVYYHEGALLIKSA